MQLDIEAPDSRNAIADWTPLIDVIFQLLVFFMLTSTFIVPHINLILPKAEAKIVSDDSPKLVLSIDDKGALYVNGQPCDENGARLLLRDAANIKPGRSVFLHADKNLPYERILSSIVLAREAGLTNIELMYEK